MPCVLGAFTRWRLWPRVWPRMSLFRQDGTLQSDEVLVLIGAAVLVLAAAVLVWALAAHYWARGRTK